MSAKAGRPLGCLTGTAIITAVLAGAFVLAAAVATGNGIFSPGPLSAERDSGPLGGVASHVDLEARCEACHPAILSGERMADLCLACHVEVKQELATDSGFHGTFETGDGCRDCHTDHQGRTASLTDADPAGFPHERTGYSLEAHPLRAAGGDVSCRDCHPATLTVFSPPTCLTCHEDRDAPYMATHVSAFGPICLDCHDGIDTYGAAFDHATYPLEGDHEKAGCTGCHPGARTLPALRSAPTECAACHAVDDVHEGRLGVSCGDCHTPATWRDATIDHDRTRFPLTGEHLEASCLECHVDRRWTGIGTTCVACHVADDPHDGQFEADCVACHSTSDWDDVTFSHASTGFELTGGHAEPSCADCHPAGRYAGTPTTCVGCHRGDDAHAGQFGTDCAACHKTGAWKPATFAGHPFPLNHGGAGGTCATCHPTSYSSYVCVGCHVHAPAIMVEKHHEVVGFALTTCVRCHPGGRGGDD